jgi:BolA family transcriptional regulator, general stress-responsive regulator
MKLFEQIKKKINNEIKAENITLIDNSRFHNKHKSFDPSKSHIKIIIQSDDLKKMSKIEAHKKIFSILRDEMKSKIHALQIEIK